MVGDAQGRRDTKEREIWMGDSRVCDLERDSTDGLNGWRHTEARRNDVKEESGSDLIAYLGCESTGLSTRER